MPVILTPEIYKYICVCYDDVCIGSKGKHTLTPLMQSSHGFNRLCGSVLYSRVNLKTVSQYQTFLGSFSMTHFFNNTDIIYFTIPHQALNIPSAISTPSASIDQAQAAALARFDEQVQRWMASFPPGVGYKEGEGVKVVFVSQGAVPGLMRFGQSLSQMTRVTLFRTAHGPTGAMNIRIARVGYDETRIQSLSSLLELVALPNVGLVTAKLAPETWTTDAGIRHLQDLQRIAGREQLAPLAHHIDSIIIAITGSPHMFCALPCGMSFGEAYVRFHPNCQAARDVAQGRVNFFGACDGPCQVGVTQREMAVREFVLRGRTK